MTRHVHANWALLASLQLVLLFVGQGIAFLAANAQTYDEAAYLVAGYSHLARGDFRLMPEHPPLLKELCALPVYLWYRLPFEPDPERYEPGQIWSLSEEFLYENKVPSRQMLTLARLPNFCLGILLVAGIGWWSYRLWGVAGGLTGLVLAALEPNLLAHSCLATTDLGIALFSFEALYSLWEYENQPSYSWLLAGSLALGLALVSKFSALLLVPSMALVVMLRVRWGAAFPLPWNAGQSAPSRRSRQRIVQALYTLLLMFLFASLLILPAYFFQGYKSWIGGISWQLTRQAGGQRAYLWGEVSSQGWLSYFALAFLLKSSLGMLLLLLLSLVLPRRGTRLRRREVLYLLLPSFLFFLAITWTRLDLGIRYLLPVYPFLIVCAARVATFRFRQAWLTPTILGVALFWTAFTVLRLSPHHLAYFNELAGGPAQGHRHLSDSNIDWGQDLLGLHSYLESEGVPMIYLAYFGTAPPRAYGIRHQPLPTFPGSVSASAELLPERIGKTLLAISVVHLHGVYLREPTDYHWLAARSPVARIGYSIHVYDITEDADAHWQLANLYSKAGSKELASRELSRVLALQPRHRKAANLLENLSQNGAIRPEGVP